MKSTISEPFYILFGCFCFFTGISLFGSDYETLKEYDFLSDIKKEIVTGKSTTKKEGKKSTKNIKTVESDNGGLNSFFLCLDSLQRKKKQKVRIAHFGDSMIEGDLITGTLREQFQKMFGGSGVGFIAATPPDPDFRQSITQEYSPNWETVSIKDKDPGYDIGISGYTSLTSGDTWVKLQSLEKGNALRVFYGGNESNKPFNLEIDSVKSSIHTDSSFNEYIQPISSQAATLKFSSASKIPVYGLSIESDSGIIVDNFSFRGSAGTFFKDYNKELLHQFQEHLQYDLIILQYGTNVADAKTTDYKWYERNMLANLNYLKSAFPHTAILLIGCGDRAVKYNGKYSTSKGIEPLIETQVKMADSTGCGFLNLYKAMGGKNSMIKWVTGDTCFANKDFTHFNRKGGEKAGQLIYSSIIKDFENWKKKQIK